MSMGNLTGEQNARADALLVARNILSNKAPFGGASLPYDEGITEDLVDLAEWVLSGRHPLDRYLNSEKISEDVITTHDGTVLGLVGDAPDTDEGVEGHTRVTGLVSMRPGVAAGVACSCGWHSHKKTFDEHLLDIKAAAEKGDW